MLAAATMATTGTAVMVLEVAAALVVACVAVFVLTSLVTAALLALAVRRGLRRMPPLDQLGRPFALSEEQVAVLQRLNEPVLDVSLVERGLVTLGGPVTQGWELRASDGTVDRAQS